MILKPCSRDGESCPIICAGENTGPGYVGWCEYCGAIMQVIDNYKIEDFNSPVLGCDDRE